MYLFSSSLKKLSWWFFLILALCYSWIACQLDIGTSLGRRRNYVQFQIRGDFWIPQPTLHGAIILIFL